jgi:hypothetical protein
MKSGLPSLLDAIFGKKDLASVSLDEIHELLNEFPSFNAAHFLLSKKLKQESDSTYEKETMRTALYFNNAFWLQSILDEENNQRQEERPFSYKEINGMDADVEETYTVETFKAGIEVFEEKMTVEPDQQGDGFQVSENDRGTVTSFDELISKYNIEVQEPFPETFSVQQEQTLIEPVEDTPADTKTEFHSELFIEPVQESPVESDYNPIEAKQEPFAEEKSEFFEIREEIINEYGIFEEVIVKKTEYDLEAFDRPIEEMKESTVTAPVEIPPANIVEANLQETNFQREEFQESDFQETIISQAEIMHENIRQENIPPEEFPETDFPEVNVPQTEIPVSENENIVENQIRDKSADKTDVGDYEAFDRPIDNTDQPDRNKEPEIKPEYEADSRFYEEDDTEISEADDGESRYDADVQIQKFADSFAERSKLMAPFDAKKAESIVFAPYHMIDYFASQGIRLVLEDQPVDQFGKQLKSFTDWLKVMKRLPSQPLTGKGDEKEVDRIRHFAAHSIEDRDILTESMAEVLAKQGMYENAIALYQKLSLIYPPKSAYFASRIEQLKASLP